MDSHKHDDLDALLDDLRPDLPDDADEAAATPRRDSRRLLTKIPVQLTLEVGAATVSLAELMNIDAGSVLELDRPAGDPLVVKVNGTTVGHAEVVVTGENYGLRIVDLEQLGDFTP